MGHQLSVDITAEVKTFVTITHWVPIVTFCPVNKLPDLIYVSIMFEQFKELYAVRRRIKKLLQWKRMFMEEAALALLDEFPDATLVEVKLLFDKHNVTIISNVQVN